MPRRLLPSLATAAALLAGAGLAACGDQPVRKPPQPAGIVTPGEGEGTRGHAPRPIKPDTSNPSGSLIACLAKRRVAAHPTSGNEVAIDPPEAGIHLRFVGTDGDAQSAQLRGDADGAEVILNALLYVGQGTDAQLKPVETCVAKVAK